MFIRYALSTYVTVHNIQSVCDLTVLPCQPGVPLFTLMVDMHNQEPKILTLHIMQQCISSGSKDGIANAPGQLAPTLLLYPMTWCGLLIDHNYDMTCQNLSQFFFNLESYTDTYTCPLLKTFTSCIYYYVVHVHTKKKFSKLICKLSDSPCFPYNYMRCASER